MVNSHEVGKDANWKMCIHTIEHIMKKGRDIAVKSVNLVALHIHTVHRTHGCASASGCLSALSPSWPTSRERGRSRSGECSVARH